MKHEVFGIRFKGEKDLIRFLVSAVFWMLVINNVADFFNIINTGWKFAIYAIGVFITYRLLVWSS